MRAILDSGETIVLGKLETAPTIGMTDFSRRETDDFGVTTVVQRGFSRTMAVRLAVPYDQVDALQRRLAALRATPVRWVADQRFASLDVRGFYKDFELDLAVPPLAYCRLTVEGLAETEATSDTGVDPAPTGETSTLRMLRPVAIIGAVLASSSVPEGDAPTWSSTTSYARGARVIAAHRVYESLIAGNLGADPATSPPSGSTRAPRTAGRCSTRRLARRPARPARSRWRSMQATSAPRRCST